MNVANKLIVHCADTPNGKHFDAEDIDRWHGERTPPFVRSVSARNKCMPNLAHIGYHYVILVDGTVEQGRAEDEIGAHCQGENERSIGVCLIGTDQFTVEQWGTLRLLQLTKGLPVFGHREFPSAHVQGKTCPNFDVSVWAMNGYNPVPGAVLETLV